MGCFIFTPPSPPLTFSKERFVDTLDKSQTNYEGLHSECQFLMCLLHWHMLKHFTNLVIIQEPSDSRAKPPERWSLLRLLFPALGQDGVPGFIKFEIIFFIDTLIVWWMRCAMEINHSQFSRDVSWSRHAVSCLQQASHLSRRNTRVRWFTLKHSRWNPSEVRVKSGQKPSSKIIYIVLQASVRLF